MTRHLSDAALFALLVTAGLVGYSYALVTGKPLSFAEWLNSLTAIGTLAAVAAAIWVPKKIKADEIARDEELDRQRLRALVIYIYPALLTLRAQVDIAVNLFQHVIGMGLELEARRLAGRFEKELRIELPQQLRLAVSEFEVIATSNVGATLMLPLSLIDHHTDLYKYAYAQEVETGNWHRFLEGFPTFLPNVIAAQQAMQQAMSVATAIYGSLPVDIKVPPEIQEASDAVARATLNHVGNGGI